MKPVPIEQEFPLIPKIIRWWGKFAPGMYGDLPTVVDAWKKYGHLERRQKEPGRNDPCWCGSGRKYKKCCGAV